MHLLSFFGSSEVNFKMLHCSTLPIITTEMPRCAYDRHHRSRVRIQECSSIDMFSVVEPISPPFTAWCQMQSKPAGGAIRPRESA